MDEKLLEPSDVAHIATLPTLNEARAKIVGILAAPAQKIVSILLDTHKNSFMIMTRVLPDHAL